MRCGASRRTRTYRPRILIGFVHLRGWNIATWTCGINAKLNRSADTSLWLCPQNDMSRMRWVALFNTKYESPSALQQVITQVADPEGAILGKTRCAGGREFGGRFLVLSEVSGVKVETNASYTPPGTGIAERGFGTTIGVAPSLLVGARHHPDQRWAQSIRTAVCTMM